MSDLVRAIWNAKAAEIARIRQAYQEIAFLSIPGNLGRDLQTTGTPTTANEIDVENLILDPLGRSGEWQKIWGTVNGKLAQIDVPDLPRFPYAVQSSAIATADMALYAAFDPDVGGTHHWQVYLKSNWLSATNAARIRQNFSPFAVVGEPVVLSASVADWTRVGGVVELPIPSTALSKEVALPLATLEVASTVGFPPAGQLLVDGQIITYTGIETGKFTGCTGGEGSIPKETAVVATSPGEHRLEFLASEAEAGKMAFMTGATVVAGSFAAHRHEPTGVPDPEPFSGDLATTDRYTYDWAGARHHSRSRRYGDHFNLLAMREQEAGFSVDPGGMSHAQRQTYVLARWQARRKPWATTFVRLIAIVISSETGEDVEEIELSIRVIEDFAHYSFKLEIPYSPVGVLTDRIKRLVEDIHPAHLNIDVDTDITWGSFRADISKAGEPV
jgi:hypothetical protein